MKLPVSHLIPGMKLSRPVYGYKGQMLLNSGVELTSSYIYALRRHKVLAVVVESLPGCIYGINEKEAELLLEERIRIRAMASLQEWVESGRKHEYFENIVEQVCAIVDEILSGRIPSGGLAEISVADVYTFAHSIDVCVFSVYMGINYGYGKEKLLKLGLGSILHDLGKVRVDPGILNKPGQLAEEEFVEIKKHPIWGYEMLTEELPGQISDSSLEIVLNHHERCNRSGYPRGINGGEISDLVTICAIADVYSAMITERVYRKAFSPNEAYEMIMANSDIYFNFELVKLFASCVNPYPIETLVLLNNGKVGCVKANNRNLPLRPIITMLQTGEQIDLSKELSFVIKRALAPEEARGYCIFNYSQSFNSTA